MRFGSCREVDVPGATLKQKLERAKGYPYARPDASFIFADGKAHSLSDDLLWKGTPDLAKILSVVARSSNWDPDAYNADTEWHAVLAIGSNASPEQLARKYRDSGGVIIPVVQCVMHDFDVVYAPLVSSYGSCTATLAHAPGTVVEVFVTYLTSALLDQMIETEGAYDLVKLHNIDLKTGLSLAQFQDGKEAIDQLDTVLQFNHQKGALLVPLRSSSNGNTSPIALSAIPAQHRPFPAMHQVEMLTHIMHETHRSADDIDLDDWIQRNLENEDVRQALVQELLSSSRPFDYPHTEVTVRIGHVYSKNVQ